MKKPNLNRYEDVLKYIYTMLPMYQRQGTSAFKKDLTNIIALCGKLGNPEDGFRSIHVAGTNGKGSVSHILAYLLMLQGYKVGLYTSPHYKDFRERIKINGKLCSKQFVKQFIRDIHDDILEIQPSFFEITVAMAFQYFKQEKVDFAVVEVGLGGRLDSTNVLTPDLSLITNISLDHVAMLGDTIPKIASEKAGIIKKNVPALIGETQSKTTGVFTDKANSVEAPIEWIDKRYHLQYVSTGKTNKCRLMKGEEEVVSFETDLIGPFQEKNLLTAFGAFDQLDIDHDYSKVTDNFLDFQNKVQYLGRWQTIDTSPDIMVDSAHNVGGMQYLSKYLTNNSYDHLHIILGVVNDKDLDAMLPNFPKSATYYFAKANIPRGLAAHVLRDKAEQHGLVGRSYTSIRKALAAAKRKAKTNDLIFVGGSIFTVAEVL